MDTQEGLRDLSPQEVAGAVSERYAEGAKAVEAELCCPVDYDGRYLAALPEEILERDYGCGDPSKHLHAGETVLDLGSGGGKICYIASQVVGAAGRVIGVDMTPDMLDLARRHRATVAERVGWDNVEFRRGRIEDLRLDLDTFDAWLAAHPVADADGWTRAEAEAERLRAEEPMVADASVDVVVSNCVLNLVAPGLKRQLFAEVFRALKPGGRAVISDIVSDAEVPLALQQDAELWSGCISGAFEEAAFLQAFVDAGFVGVEVLERQQEAWREVEGIAFRSLTVAAYKRPEGDCRRRGQQAIYRGPFAAVEDDMGNRYARGDRLEVGERTWATLGAAPYAAHFDRLDADGAAAPGTADGDGGGCC